MNDLDTRGQQARDTAGRAPTEGRRDGRYLRGLLIATVVLVAGVAAFCGLVDPYGVLGTPAVAGLTVQKPGAADRPRLAKAYRVEQMDPATILMGSSTTNIGFDPESRAWTPGHRPVFNLGINGSKLSDQLHFLRHALVHAHPKLVVLPVLFEDTLISPQKRLSAADVATYGYAQRMRVLPDGSPNPGYWRGRLEDVAFSLLSFPAIIDSVRTLLGQGRPGLDFQTEAGFDNAINFQRWTRDEGSFAVVSDKNFEKSSQILRWMAAPETRLRDLGNMIAAARQAGAEVVVMIAPAHVDEMQIRHQLGLDARIAAWRQELADIVQATAAATGGVSHVTLWDFDGLSAYTDQPLPAQGDTAHPLTWFYETVHFRPTLGTLMIERIEGGGPADLGSVVTAATIGAATARQQAALEAWGAAHPADVARIYGVITTARERLCPPSSAGCTQRVAAQ